MQVVLDNQMLICSQCGKSDDTVHVRDCGYSLEINNAKVEEVICDSCEHEHLMDI